MESALKKVEDIIKEIKVVVAKISIIKADPDTHIAVAKDDNLKKLRGGLSILEDIEQKIMNYKEMSNSVDKKDVIQAKSLLAQLQECKTIYILCHPKAKIVLFLVCVFIFIQ